MNQKKFPQTNNLPLDYHVIQHTQKETKIIQLPAQDFFHSFPVLAPEAVEDFVEFDSA